MASLQFYQLNCHRSGAVTENLGNELPGNGVALLQEINYKDNMIMGMENFQIFCSTNKPRAAIVAGRSVPAWQCSAYSGCDMATAVISRDQMPDLYVVSLYMDCLLYTSPSPRDRG